MNLNRRISSKMMFVLLFSSLPNASFSATEFLCKEVYSDKSSEELVQKVQKRNQSIDKRTITKNTVKGENGLLYFYGRGEIFLDGKRCSNQCPAVKYYFHECLLEKMSETGRSSKDESAIIVCSMIACDP